MTNDPAQIIATVADIYGISTELLRSAVKSQSIVHARGVAVHLIRINTRCSFVEIGKLLSRDHTSVMRCQRRLLQDASASGEIMYAQARLGGAIDPLRRAS